MQTFGKGKIKRVDPAFWFYVLATVLALACAGGLLFFLVMESFPIFYAYGAGFLSGSDWWPGEVYGILPMIFGSLMVTVLALFVALPVALAGAIYISEFLSPHFRLLAKSAMELLAGVPGIIYGLMGVTVLTVWVRDVFGLIDGNSILAAGLLLGIMILPVVMTLSEDALHAVPAEYRDAALSLGLTKLETVLSVSLPQARMGIAGAIFLGLGRAMGETIAVMLVIGGLDRIPVPWYDLFAPGQSISSKLGREAAEAIGSGLQWNALMGMGLALFVIVMTITLMGNMLVRRMKV